VSNPLNGQIAELLAELMKLEAERDRTEDPIRHMYPLAANRPEILESIKPRLEAVQRLNQTIDAKRQKLVSLELLMLDNSIKDLQMTTRQVDGSVESLETTTGHVDDSIKSLQETTKEVLKSSSKLERLTSILIIATILVGVIAFYQTTLTLAQSIPFAGWVGSIGSALVIVYLFVRILPRMLKRS
jgi:chromosome segregation ATPase